MAAIFNRIEHCIGNCHDTRLGCQAAHEGHAVTVGTHRGTVNGHEIRRRRVEHPEANRLQRWNQFVATFLQLRGN